MASEAKRKVFEEILDLAKARLGESLKAKAPKAEKPVVESPADADAGDESCEDCETGDCDKHEAGKDAKSKLMELLGSLEG